MSLHNVGDQPLLTYTLIDPSTGAPTNGITVVTMTRPDGTTVTVPGGTWSPTGTFRVAPILDVAGDYSVLFTTTSPAYDVEEVRLVALDSTARTAPGWAPTLQDVAVHIPTRTRRVGLDNSYSVTFDADTTPTGDAVSVLIEHACSWVAGMVGAPIADAAFPQCTVAAALWAAYWAEIGYPERDADVTVYERLRVDALAAVDAARATNLAAGGGGTVAPDAEAVPVTLYAFPDAQPLGDWPVW